MRRIGVALCVTLLAGLLAPGCKQLQEKQALRRYAKYEERVRAARRHVEAMDAELERLALAGDVARLRPLLKDRYLPAYRAWVATLRALPATTTRLRKIRSALLARLAASLEAHERFYDRLHGALPPDAWTGLERVRQAVTQAEARYQTDLDAYYREHDLRRSRR